ncbi:MAG TPA: HD domain-containing protein [Blastocatellia bacterium]|nr:HD domain-containing protein [Blastocatellia bacterium]
MNREVLVIADAVREAGGRAMLVGGFVRDYLLGIESKDYDMEVYGLDPERLRRVLDRAAPVNTVGEHFAVYKLAFASESKRGEGQRFEIDVSLPRRESKSGRGHRGFIIEGDPSMTFEEAARRRDFTINAVLLDPLTGEIVDPFRGREDLARRLLRAVAGDTFVEDSLRVLRAVQFAARFEMALDPETLALCRSIDLSDLPRERVWGEFEKLLTLAERPSLGLDVALQTRALDQLFPEIGALVGCPQDPESHPEGDAFAHTRLSLDQAVKLTRELPKERRLAVMLATLCHDLGKPETTAITDGVITSPGYDEAGVKRARALMNGLGLYTISGFDVRENVLALAREHLKPEQFYRDRASDGAFRRLALKVDLDLLHRVSKACALGRGPASSSAAQDWFLEKARELGVEHGAPDALLKGRHLLEEGFEPGPRIGEVLRLVYDLQLDGRVKTLEEALDAARRLG